MIEIIEVIVLWACVVPLTALSITVSGGMIGALIKQLRIQWVYWNLDATEYDKRFNRINDLNKEIKNDL